jgi:hypothetical protein
MCIIHFLNSVREFFSLAKNNIHKIFNNFILIIAGSNIIKIFIISAIMRNYLNSKRQGLLAINDLSKKLRFFNNKFLNLLLSQCFFWSLLHIRRNLSMFFFQFFNFILLRKLITCEIIIFNQQRFKIAYEEKWYLNLCFNAIKFQNIITFLR